MAPAMQQPVAIVARTNGALMATLAPGPGRQPQEGLAQLDVVALRQPVQRLVRSQDQVSPLVLSLRWLLCEIGATARHVIYDGQWRGSDRSPLGHSGPSLSMVAPSFLST